eukprot:snap_masked-scaffold_14-processed-gene-10.46-mRNA-1 protein AED:1.00 eAED:1.00 QI:0/0/0/0/1/1/2/0/107
MKTLYLLYNTLITDLQVIVATSYWKVGGARHILFRVYFYNSILVKVLKKATEVILKQSRIVLSYLYQGKDGYLKIGGVKENIKLLTFVDISFGTEEGEVSVTQKYVL